MLSESCQYAIKAMVFINTNKEPERKFSLSEISKAIHSPKAFTAKILQQLRKSGLLSSAIGAQGGYWVEPGKRISLKSIIEVIDGDHIFTNCVLGLKTCSSKNPCPVHEKNMILRTELIQMVEQSFLDDFTDDLKNKKIRLK